MELRPWSEREQQEKWLKTTPGRSLQGALLTKVELRQVNDWERLPL